MPTKAWCTGEWTATSRSTSGIRMIGGGPADTASVALLKRPARSLRRPFARASFVEASEQVSDVALGGGLQRVWRDTGEPELGEGASERTRKTREPNSRWRR